MSDFTAIGGVSATLQLLLADRMEPPPGLAQLPQVTVGVPPRLTPVDGETVEEARVNLFLFRLTEHAGLMNQEIPGRGSPGAYGAPPLSLVMHYLLTAYGTTEGAGQVRAHHVLGSAMRVLHDHPVITEGLRSVRVRVGDPILDASLRDEYEQLKLCLDRLGLEDLTQVWTALTLPFQLSVAYTVSVVQIESRRPRRFPRPVGEPPAAGPRIQVVPLRNPRIEGLAVRRPGDPPDRERPFPVARIGDTLVIRGRGLAGEATRVILGRLTVPVTPLSDDRIELAVPDEALPDGDPIPEERRLQPGPHSVEVVAGVPGLPRAGFRSNQAIFMLVPGVANLVPDLNAEPRTVAIAGTRLFAANLDGETLVERALIATETYLVATPTAITVPLPDTLPDQTVPCLVSGALSDALNLSDPPELQVRIGADGPHAATLADRPPTPAAAAGLLQAAIRGAPGGPAFAGARVTSVAQPGANRLVVVAGGLGEAVVVSAGVTAGELGLSAAAGATTVAGYLSGELVPFPLLTAAQPAVELTIAGVAHVVALPHRPPTLLAAAEALEAAIRGAGGEPGFAAARVVALDGQLLILPGAGEVRVEPVAGVDETSAAELRLRARYPVRVRVNGAESIDDVGLDLPP